MNYNEITKEAFTKLVDIYNTPVSLGEELEHARKTHFSIHGVKLLMIDNYLSNVTQYYIQDINAWKLKEIYGALYSLWYASWRSFTLYTYRHVVFNHVYELAEGQQTMGV